MGNLSLIQTIIVWAVPVIFAITVHEVSHGWVANRLGDTTAKMMGRLTLNPIKHIDPIGTIAVPALLIIMHTGFIFGWAKPVPVNWNNLKNPRRDIALVAIAGPIANLLMAIFWAIIAKIGISLGQGSVAQLCLYMGAAGIMINFILMILNIIPIPPLDGSRVVSSFLKPRWAYYYNRLESYGFIILLLLLFTGILGKIIMPALILCLNFTVMLFNIPPQAFMG